MFRRVKIQTADTERFERKPVERITASPNMGLTMDQVRAYRENGWDNRPVQAPSKSVRQIIKTNVCTYFNLVFAAITVLLIMAGAFGDLVFLPIIIANTLIGIVQELNAKRILDKLNVLHAPRTQVIRNGITNPVSSEMLVLDDIVVFHSGDQICADAIVVEGEVSVNESLLTGESDEIFKASGDFLLSGSFIVSGTCKARLERVGADSYISKLTLEAKAAKEGEQSEMIRSLDRLVRAIGIIIIPIGFILFVQQYIYAGASIKSSVQSMVAAILGMIPEGLYLLSSVTLAVSAVKLAFDKVLVHDMKCIETLARVNVLCVDKTGTITDNSMDVNEVITLDGYYENINAPIDELLSDFAAAMTDDNITMKAIKKHFYRTSGAKADRIISFSSEFKYSAAVFGEKAYVLGAPEFVLRDQYESHKKIIEEQIGSGCRVLVFGLYDGEPDGKALTAGFKPFALITLTNPVRKDAKKTFNYFAEQGVGIKVISGDNPLTVSRVAKEAGILNAENFVDASALVSPEDISRAVREYTVFGRVTPSQKLAFIKALKAQGNTVAMTGDGVNDVLALKEADCSVAMASGSDAAAQASQLVLLESDFSRMPNVVAEGRQVVNNLERSGSLFLVKNIFSLFMALI
ncbi:MAG: HAD-IC family P-type ATPase, partial [Lachnospiraceae bacterium]|nr:HAD-IC family P-type ATPase [Lachnospiraceae bacterium]